MSFDEPKNVCDSESLMQVVLFVTYAGIIKFARRVSDDRT